MSDYDRIARAIDYIQSNLNTQPSLRDIASQLQLSPYHFQRLFSRWAGVTPKRLLQTLTLENAKRRMADSQNSILEVADSVGLSSGSRLYDHFVQLDAVTPSEYKQAGRGLAIYHGVHESLFGPIFIAVTQRGICNISFLDGPEDSALNQLIAEWPNAEVIKDQPRTGTIAESLFRPIQKTDRPISLFVRGTNFQVNVWRALLRLSQGQLTTYGDIASAIGKPQASRAVGTAIGANPLALVIPCHRVIRQDGQLGGYRWGVVRKQAILAMETAGYK